LIKDLLQDCRVNKKVFITPPWKEIYKTDGERDQTFEEAADGYQRLFEWYQKNDYEMIILPKTSVEHRVDLILSEMKF